MGGKKKDRMDDVDMFNLSADVKKIVVPRRSKGN